jgi:hypothetical protein
MDRRLGEPLPHQQANPPRARPWSEAEATFSNRPEELLGHSVLIRVSPGYPDTKGGLPTCYSPVRRFPLAEARFSLDLHVLSAPPAFVLSQDQTLREEWLPALMLPRERPAILSLRAVLLLKGRLHATSGQARRDASTTRSIPVPSPRPGSGQGRSSSRRIEERSLLSFQRPVPRRKERRKKSLRLAPGGLRGCES